MKYLNKQFVRWDDIDAFGHVNNAKYLMRPSESLIDTVELQAPSG